MRRPNSRHGKLQRRFQSRQPVQIGHAPASVCLSEAALPQLASVRHCLSSLPRLASVRYASRCLSEAPCLTFCLTLPQFPASVRQPCLTFASILPHFSAIKESQQRHSSYSVGGRLSSSFVLLAA